MVLGSPRKNLAPLFQARRPPPANVLQLLEPLLRARYAQMESGRTR